MPKAHKIPGDTPTLPQALDEYARADTARFHMPGHKGLGAGAFGSSAKWDVTELSTTDDLYAPGGPILQTELAYARTYKARSSFLLVNGSTAGVTTMLLALGSNKRVLLARDCHRSAISAMALAGHEAAFVYPPANGMVTAEAVSSALAKRPADAVLIVSPDYYGRCADIAAIANACHAHGALLLVDCAHGAHFPFSGGLPLFPSALVDMWCVSAHKTLAAFTQSAVLHAGAGCPIADDTIRSALRMIQSSSPSYLLMASLDWALHSARKWDEHIERLRAFLPRIGLINGMRISDDTGPGVTERDITRVVIDVAGRGISGKEAYAALEAGGIVPEMADERNVVLITSPQDPDEWYERLYIALNALPYGTVQPPIPRPLPAKGKTVLSIREALFAPHEYVPIAACPGRICAGACGAYPPGIAALMPGEEITREACEYLIAAEGSGLSLFGIADGVPCVKGD